MKIVLAGVGVAALLMAAPAFAQSEQTTTTVVKQKGSPAAGVGIVGGAATGAAVGGPVGAVVGAVVGGVAGAAVEPPAEVKTYVRQQKVEPVEYSGPVTVGAVLPDTVTVYDVPNDNHRWEWTYVNHQRVLLDHRNRKVVAILQDAD